MNALPTSAKSQRERLLDALRTVTGGVTTHYARSELAIMSIAARVLELKRQGHNIYTYRETIDTGKAKHRKCARYVLLNGGDHE
jgi:Helix-turn-helix domain